MTDEELDRLVRGTDPYRPGLVTRLGGAEQTLLEEIVSGPAASRRRRWPSRLWRPAAVLSAAAAITGVLAVPALLAAGHRAGKPAIGFSAPVATASAGASTELLKPGGDKVLLLIDRPGWTFTHIGGFAGAEGGVTAAKGNLSLELSWYDARYYDSYDQDRLEVSPPQPGAVDGWDGDVFTYSDHDWELMLRPRGGVFVGIRTTGPWTRSGFDELLAATTRVDPRTWLAALPAGTVTPATAGRATAQALTGVPVPPGRTVSTLAIAGVNDPDMFADGVIRRVVCGWLGEWGRAQQAGDAAAAGRATAALSGSRSWPALKNMPTGGASPEVYFDLGDRVAGSARTGDKSPAEYFAELGCA